MSIQEQQPMEEATTVTEIDEWFGAWRGLQVAPQPENGAYEGPEDGLANLKEAIDELKGMKGTVESFGVQTRRDYEAHQEMFKQFGDLISFIVEIQYDLGRLIEQERPVITNADAAAGALEQQIIAHTDDYLLIEQYESDLSNLKQQLAAIEEMLDLNQQIIDSRDQTSTPLRDPNKNLADTHVSVAIEERPGLLAERDSKAEVIAELKTKIEKAKARINKESQKQITESEERQENREAIVAQAEKEVTEKFLKIGLHISKSPAVAKALMQATIASKALQAEEIQSLEN